MWNESAFQVARELWQPGDEVGEQNHATDWGQYGDLQRGDLARSRLWIERAEQTLAENPNDGRSQGTLNILLARHTIETQQWQLAELNDDLNADQLLALGMSAANLDELELAERVAARLGELAANSPANDNLQIIHAEIAALAKSKRAEKLLREGVTSNGQQLKEEALALLADAIARDERGRLPNGAANPLKPVHELAGEIHLALGQAGEAVALFETSLLRLPNRPLSLLGAARAQAALGDKQKADASYRQLLSIWNDDSMIPVQEARRFVANN